MLRRLLVPALLLAAASATRAQEAKTEPSPVDQAMEDFKAGEYAKVVAALEDLPAEDPRYPKAQYLVGESWLALGDGEVAEQVFRGLLAKKPDSSPLLAGVGRALTLQGKPDEAMEFLKKAVKADPKDAAARRAVGECLAAQNKPAEARKELEAAVRLDPKDPLTARALVEVCVRAGDTGAAGKAAEALRQADPKSGMGDFLVGLALDRKGDSKGAIAAYEAALAKDPKLLDSHKNLAILCIADNPTYQDKERTKKALEHFAKYFELGGKDEELRKLYEQIKSFAAPGTPTGR